MPANEVPLENMRRIDRARLRVLRIDVAALTATLEYDVQADDGAVMYAEVCTRDLRGVPGLQSVTLGELLSGSMAAVTADAQRKHGRPERAGGGNGGNNGQGGGGR